MQQLWDVVTKWLKLQKHVATKQCIAVCQAVLDNGGEHERQAIVEEVAQLRSKRDANTSATSWKQWKAAAHVIADLPGIHLSLRNHKRKLVG